MRRAAARGQAAACADDAHRQVLIAYRCTHLLAGAHGKERQHTHDNRDIAFQRKAGRYADTVLLCNAYIDVTIREILMELLQVHAHVGRAHKQLVVRTADFMQRIADYTAR